MQNFFLKKCLLECENQFAVEKKTKKIGGNFKKCRHQKNASHTFSINGNGMISIFIHIKVFLFHSVRYTKFYAKTEKNFSKFRRHDSSKKV